MATTESIKKLEKQIAEGLEPFCPNCGSRLNIEKGTGDTGSKAYNYYCLRQTNRSCDLMPGTAYIPWHHVLWQAAQQRVVQIGLVAIASVTVVGTGGNILGFLNFKVNEEEAVADNPTAGGEDLQKTNLLTIDSLNEVVEELERRLKRKEPPRLSTEEQNLLWEGKLRLGIERFTSPPREFDKSKKYLLSALEEYNDEQGQGLYYLGENRRNQIMEILADLMTRTPFSREELEHFIYYAEEKGYSKDTRRGHHLGIAYYHLAEEVPEKELEFKAQSLLHYLRYVRFLIPLNERPFDQAELQAKNEVFSAMEEDFALMRRNNRLPPTWEGETLKKLDQQAIKGDRRTIQQATIELEYYIEEQGWMPASTS